MLKGGLILLIASALLVLYSSPLYFYREGSGVSQANFQQIQQPVVRPNDYKHHVSVSQVNMQQLQHLVQKPNDTLYVVNFWATWCKPCVAEIPYFQEASRKYWTQKVKVVFVSLNFPGEIAQVEKFAEDKRVTEQVLLLNAGNPNNWIDTVDVSWSGAIPATVMYRHGQKVFFREGEFTQPELDSIIHTKNK